MKGITPHQLEVLRHVAAAPGDAPLDFDQLLEKLSWQPTKEAAQFTIRAAVAKKLIAKTERLILRRGRKRVCYEVASEGVLVLDPRKAIPVTSGAVEAPLEVEKVVSDFVSSALVDPGQDLTYATEVDETIAPVELEIE